MPETRATGSEIESPCHPSGYAVSEAVDAQIPLSSWIDLCAKKPLETPQGRVPSKRDRGSSQAWDPRVYGQVRHRAALGIGEPNTSTVAAAFAVRTPQPEHLETREDLGVEADDLVIPARRIPEDVAQGGARRISAGPAWGERPEHDGRSDDRDTDRTPP